MGFSGRRKAILHEHRNAGGSEEPRKGQVAMTVCGCSSDIFVVVFKMCGNNTKVEGGSASVLSARIVGKVVTFLTSKKLVLQGWIVTSRILILKHFSLRTSLLKTEDPPLCKQHSNDHCKQDQLVLLKQEGAFAEK